VLKRALACEDHGHLGPGLVTGLDGFEIAVRSPRMNDGRYALFDSHVHSVPEGEEGVGDHRRPFDSPAVFPGLPVDLFFGCRVPFALSDFHFQSL